MRPFVSKKKLFNNPRTFQILGTLGLNKQKRVMFLLEDLKTNNEFVTDFNRETFYKIKSKLGKTVSDWTGKIIVLSAKKWTSDTYYLEVGFHDDQ